ncbi:aliphatic amidase regulator [Mycolicibacterium fortuitum subsp. fortuitum DSM 46621 = ATCC 6841 = JCM 6387]|uniref:Aliphatic amidase regulator n=2 Tax=Mycolicibacterium fortuitum TaxID=1766 RepID=K0V697_MYCFO|nr:Putative nitrile hydratase regulator clustered with urea transport [Mycobacterium sp. VKM Ac-1817D]EJZ10313.1 aliphatic amidase regulator [Mycolicibacterium fortuitum subsp. fortuitum DSM 46621 = ATCC 6841 = JCM 6387]BDD97443.1 hypothetical protein MFTT_15370 [Mycolicibacterium fortuitum subsp. fortuitum]CRL57543.1 nitrile hydratase regulator1 [Mycolicibacterium fortuitum subsp. fortuitum DSM 46621 = ATCC 6841 = JCM 6387]CRL75647.1 nitrile hydratase regulator1 [Mycolicibacter nonchromogenicu
MNVRVRTVGRDAEWRLAMVVPLQGPAGIFGPSCEAVADLVAHDLNAAGGVMGREVHIEVVDGGAHPTAVAAEVKRLIDQGRIDAVSGWHISSVRHALAPVVAGRVPYTYPALYEGGERRPGIYCCGETPDQQLAPALRWMRDNLGIRKWFVVGDDYVWPRTSLSEVRRYVQELSLDLVGGSFVALGQGDIARLVDKVARSRCEAVLMLLVGQDAVEFNRAFTQRGLYEELLRFSPLMDENMLIASGHDATKGLFVAASYFRSMVGRNSMELLDRYLAVNGSGAPALGSAAESCYEGAYFLAEMIRRSGSRMDIDAVADGAAYDSPRGTVEFSAHRTRQPVHLAVADGVDFEIVTTLPAHPCD